MTISAFPKSILYGIISLLILMPLAGCSLSNTQPYSKSGLYFDTIVSVDIFGARDDPQQILDECMNICSRYEALFDKNTDTSDIARINSAGTDPVPVDHETALLISDALKYSEISGGRFDITIEPVSSLWDFHEGGEHIPEKDLIKSALTHVDHKKITVDTTNDTVTKSEAGIAIDPGAVAKGYIADSIAGYLSSCRISGSIINMGGDMRLIGSRGDGSAYNIGINDPKNPGTVFAALYLTDTSVATSGIYERAFYVDGKRYHHILDVSDGYPVDTDIESVTVITKDSVDCDCLCTVAIILGSEEALKLIENIDDTEAFFILTDGTVIQTSGMDKYIRN